MKRSKLFRILASYSKILKKTVTHFGANRPVELAGTTAYFAIFSIAPILIIIISVFGYFTGSAAIRDKLFTELNVLIGTESSRVLQHAIDNYQIANKSGIGAIIGVVFFLISATTLFSTMQNSINYIWRVQVKSNLKMNIFMLLKDRLFSFGVILSLGFILLVSLVADASIAFLKDILRTYFSPHLIILAQIANIFLSLGLISVGFTIIYRFLPDVKVRWSPSWFGGIFTAIMFVLGKILIGIIIGSSNLGAVYGAASSFIIILLWIYYASLIFYFGVELTHQFSIYYKHENPPVNYAVPFEITALERSKHQDEP